MNHEESDCGFLLAALCCFMPGLAGAEEPEIYTLLSPKGKVLTRYQGQCEKGDEYISGRQ